MWDFSTDPEFQEKLDWATAFVKQECEALDLLFPLAGDPYDVNNKAARTILEPLRDQVKAQGLWACHLGVELGGQGYGQLKLALLNEILGRSYWAPTVFGTAAPDTGNAEILAMYGTPAQKALYLQPLLDGQIVSSFSMTEPQGGADPKQFVCRAVRDGDEWVIDGEKWFSSNARYASFLIVMAVTDPDAAPHERMSMFILPAGTPGIEIIRNVATVNERDELDEGIHAYVGYRSVRVPLDAMLGGPGEGFKVAQSRLGGGRVHHAMRVVGKCQRAFEMMCERAVSRTTQGKLLADHQFVQGFIADTAIQLAQFRLLVLQTAWIIDTQPHGAARTQIAMCKVALAQVIHDVMQKAVHLHGSSGTTHETPLGEWWANVPQLALADGPTEVHKTAISRGTLRNYPPAPGLFPSEHSPTRRAEAHERYAAVLADFGAMTEPKTPAQLFDLSGQVAIVTGGSRGLGLQIVLGFAAAGADVVIASRKIDNCRAVAEQVEALGRRALPVACHVGHWDECATLADAAYDYFGHVDILVNNAGMSPLAPSSVETSEELFDKVVGVNFKGPFRLSALIGQRMFDGDGAIINVSSSGALIPSPRFGPYAGAKAALNALTLVLAREFAPKVRVNTLSAGPFLTDIAKGWPEESKRTWHNAAGRAGQPEEVVSTALYLASAASSYTSGAMVRVDGGLLKFWTRLPGLSRWPTADFAGPQQNWQVGLGTADFQRLARHCDDLGYDAITVPEHLAVPTSLVGDLGAYWPDALTVMSFLAGATSRIRVNSGVIVAPLHHPVRLAKAVATLDQLSGGRVMLTFGVGMAAGEFAALGVDFHQRGRITDEYTAALRTLWSPGPAEFHGQFVDFQDVVLEPRPLQQPHPPIFFGGRSMAALRRAARLGDGWAPSGSQGGVGPWLRRPADLPMFLAEARREAGFVEREERFEIALAAQPTNIDREHRLTTPATRLTSTQQVIDLVAELQSAGVTWTYVAPLDPGPQSLAAYLEYLEWAATEVLVHFRR